MRGYARSFPWGMAAALAALACQPTTRRPGFTPFPEAAVTEVRLGRADAVVQLAAALRADSLPVAHIQPRDGYLDSGWFRSGTGRPFHGRPVGEEIVRVRAWADPARPYASLLTVETVYRPLADPSLPPRELERPAGNDHPVVVRVRAILDTVVARYGGAPSAPAPGGGATPRRP